MSYIAYKVYSIKEPNNFVINTTNKSLHKCFLKHIEKYLILTNHASLKGMTSEDVEIVRLFTKFSINECDIELICDNLTENNVREINWCNVNERKLKYLSDNGFLKNAQVE